MAIPHEKESQSSKWYLTTVHIGDTPNKVLTSLQCFAELRADPFLLIWELQGTQSTSGTSPLPFALPVVFCSGSGGTETLVLELSSPNKNTALCPPGSVQPAGAQPALGRQQHRHSVLTSILLLCFHF